MCICINICIYCICVRITVCMHVGGCNINKKVLKKSKHIYVACVNAHMSTGNDTYVLDLPTITIIYTVATTDKSWTSSDQCAPDQPGIPN